MKAKKRAKKKPASWRTSRDPHSCLVRAMGRYMKSRGWNVLVAGQVQIESIAEAKLGNHRFVMPFVGTRSASTDAARPEET